MNARIVVNNTTGYCAACRQQVGESHACPNAPPPEPCATCGGFGIVAKCKTASGAQAWKPCPACGRDGCITEMSPPQERIPAGTFGRDCKDPVLYPADGTVRGEPIDDFGRVRSGRFMPRWASRITLEVTGVRVERLQGVHQRQGLMDVESVGVGGGVPGGGPRDRAF